MGLTSDHPTSDSAYVVEPIPSRNIPDVWPYVSDMVGQACISQEMPTHSIDDILNELMMTDRQLWIVTRGSGDEMELAGVCVTARIEWPRVVIVEGSIAGKNWMSWRPELERVVGAWARQVGAAKLLLQTSSPTLAKLYLRRGWTELTRVFVKDVP